MTSITATAESTIKSAERVMRVLRFLATRSRPTPTLIIASNCNVPRSSTYGLLNVMRECEFVTYIPNNRGWTLGPGAFEIGLMGRRTQSIAWTARPVLMEVMANTQHATRLATLHASEARYVLAGRAGDQVASVDLRLPGFACAAGRAMLMHLPAQQVRLMFPPHEHPQLAGLSRELEQARDEGYVAMASKDIPGQIDFAMAARGTDGWPIAAIECTLRSGGLREGAHNSALAELERAVGTLEHGAGARQAVAA